MPRPKIRMLGGGPWGGVRAAVPLQAEPAPSTFWHGCWRLAVGSPFDPAREELGLQDVTGGPAGGYPEAGFRP